jgi:hypothetical protein
MSVVQSPVIVLPESPTVFTVSDAVELVVLPVVADAILDGELVPIVLIADTR